MSPPPPLLVNVLTSDSKEPEDTHLTILFKYTHDSNERLFNFKRSKDELLADMVKRMRINFEKAFIPKAKKKSPGEQFNLELAFLCQKNVVDLGNTRNRDFWIDGSEVHINGLRYHVRANQPTILQLKLSPTILIGYLTYPNVEILNGTIAKSAFTWYRAKEKSTDSWEEVAHSFTYLVTENDLGYHLKVICQPSDGVNNGISQEVESTKEIVPGPRGCPFERRIALTQTVVPANQIRIVSYNLLADIYADSTYSQDSLYPYCKPKFLAFDYRKLLILRELQGYNADLIFLQEVDKHFMVRGIGPLFDQLGYGSHFLCKIQMVEGLAIFYRRSKFTCHFEESHTFSGLLLNNQLFADLKAKVETNELLLTRISKLKNSLQVLLLAQETEKRLLLVCNLHLYSKDDADHIRLIQAYLCFKYVEVMIAKLKSDSQYSAYTISYIISGDFNSTPEWGVIRLVQSKQVDSSLEDFRINQAELIHDVLLAHSLDMSSACGFPLYTNYTQNFTGCLDYILHEPASLRVVETVPMPSHEDVIKDTALPSETIPSDHLALVCTLEWTL